MRHAFPMYLVAGVVTLFGGIAVAGAVTTTSRTTTAQKARPAAAAQHPSVVHRHNAKHHGSTRTHRRRHVTRRMLAMQMMRHRITPRQRRAAARHTAALGAVDSRALVAAPATLRLGTPVSGRALTPGALAPGALAPGATPDYFGTTPNYANSPLPTATAGGITGGIRKFRDALPDIPVAVPDTTTYPGADYYVIELRQYTQRLSSDLPPTTLRGYVQINKGTAQNGQNTVDPAPIQDLGPMIQAHRNRPVRVKFTNKLSTGTEGNLFLPVDKSVMGAGTGPNLGTETYTQNRASLHLHGGTTPWISDGTEHQWITPAGEQTSYPKGVSVRNVPDMADPGAGSETLYYTNQQSARLMFYHDHSYGITRLNVYAGEEAPYIVDDPVERQLVTDNVIPSDQMPLMIQDRTFVPNDAQLAAQDPTWDKSQWGGEGHLWFPHVYMPNQNPFDDSGANAMGRWDYGPWFWPPFAGLANGPVANPYYDPVSAPWEPPQIPGTPNPSITPESFMDTPLVNGAAYPVKAVQRKAYRLRILNASNDRSLNLQLYYAKSNSTMWNPNGSLASGDSGEVPMVPAVKTDGFPDTWPTDGRDGGVPDPAAAGPNLVQIGTEGGFLPAPVVLDNQPVGYNYNRRDITVLNVNHTALFLGPAERADVIVDFSQVPAGSKLILYNDAPAPVPAFDPRYDYYTGDPDQTSTGGAPSTLPGYGPNTRTVMQFQVGSDPAAPAFSLSTLQARLPQAYGASQDKPLVPEKAYDAAFGTTTTNTYSRIQDTSASFFNGPLSSLDLTAGGTGYTNVPAVSFSGGGGSGAAATATLAPRAVSSLDVANGGSGYLTAPSVSISGGGGSGAAATATLGTRKVATVQVAANGSNYTSTPAVSLSGGGGTGATAIAVVSNRRVTSVLVTNGGSGYTSLPAVTFTGGGGGSGAKGTAVLGGAAVVSLAVTSGGTGFTSPPTITISGGSGSGATATATLTPATVGSVTLTLLGDGYTSAPTVTFTGGGGTGATAVAHGLTMTLQPKSIIEDFDPEFGRMNAMLGTEVPNTNSVTQTSIPYYDTDPPTEVLKGTTSSATKIGSESDGTQIWKITHNGVDTHSMHWHMFDVQLLNRVGWDGAIRPPDPNEVGWKETVRMNPLEDVIVALRPIVPDVPFDLPNSVRALDPTKPIGSVMGFHNVDPTNQPAPVTNALVNFGWEYLWHCHLLGHEENVMMRPMAVAVPPRAPTTLTAQAVSRTVRLSWRDASVNETGFTVQRAGTSAGPWTTVKTDVATASSPGTGGTVAYTDSTVTTGATYVYRIVATNLVGYTQTYAAPAAGYPTMSADSAPSAASGSVRP